jgi:iron complex outermembrane receptor protein
LKNLFLAFCASLIPFLASAQFSVSGKVTDGQTNLVLPNASITLLNQNIKLATDSSGKYYLHNLKQGTYTISVTYIGYESITKMIDVKADMVIDFKLNPESILTNVVTINGARAEDNSPTTFTNLSKKDIAKNNLGQDLPYLVDQTPSLVTQSDAGAGVGYTYLHIRGSDGSRINVTINGVPYNDSEEQASYFVDIPDIASSVDNIQIQRGVGTSTNGAGAFGASINIQTTARHDTSYLLLNNSIGSYNTIKNTISMSTGLLNGHFSFDGRLSRIVSDGYIDRASSNLQSYFLNGAYYAKNTQIKLITFGGTEHTYQAWNGIPEDTLRSGNRHYNGLGLEPNGTYYKNQTDNYTQNHYQLLVDQKISDRLIFSGALHYTHGFGYYEEYQPMQPLANYGITPVIFGSKMIDTTDLTRRLWLNNKFYGITYNLKYKPSKGFNILIGGAYNEYKGAHYDNIEWTQQSTNIPPDYQYLRNDAEKTDFNIFGKIDYTIGKATLFADMQYRHIYYSFLGYNENLENVQQNVDLDFFNPKLGITYQLNAASNIYASMAVGNHEPNRNDYVQSTPASRPLSENLKDFELGYRIRKGVFSGGINAYYMLYKNQLVLTGALNDVGDQNRSNVKDSYRAGVEFEGRLRITDKLTWEATAALSRNKVQNFQQYLGQYVDGNYISTIEYTYENTDIAFSPSFIGSSTISYKPIIGGEIALISKYVGKQYLDNTSNTNPPGFPPSDLTSNRALNSYFLNAVRLGYNFNTSWAKNIGITLLVNNIFSTKYESNGATYPDIENGKVVNYNYYFPQAPANFLLGLNLKF